MLGQLKPTKYAKTASLEQLTWLEHGFKIYAHESRLAEPPISINFPEDALVMERRLS